MKSFDPNLIARLASEYGTPLYVYDADCMRERIAKLRRFDVIRFAQKALSNIHVLRLMNAEGVLVDAVSHGELERAMRAGFTSAQEPAGVVFTADIIDDETLDTVIARDIPVNAGGIEMLEQIGRRKPGHRVWLRINPGFGHGHSRKTNTGGEWSKHGIWHAQIDDALALVRRYELDLVGLHMHIGSGSDFEHLKQVCNAMVDVVRRARVDVRAISGGGGLPIPYRSDDARFDTIALYDLWDIARRDLQKDLGHDVSLEIEPGRFLVGESGLLVSRVWGAKDVSDHFFATVDAGFNDLVRPAMYGSHHEISVLRADGELVAPGDGRPTVISGPLCESGDVFTQDEGGIVSPRWLPGVSPGDLVVFHDAGAYASSMASNYNSRGLGAEVLLEGANHRLIRRRQTIQDLLELEEV